MASNENKRARVARKPNDEINEAVVPLLLRIALCASIIAGGAQARLRRARRGWRLTASPLAKLQRLIIVIPVSAGISAVVFDFLSEENLQVHLGKTIVTEAVCVVEVVLVTVPYIIGVLTAMGTEPLISMLHTIHKIKTSLKWTDLRFQMRYSRIQHGLLIFFILWAYISYIGEVYALAINKNLSSMYISIVYMSLVSKLLQLEWSIAVLEINSTLTLVNYRLEVLLKMTTSDIDHFSSKSLHRLNVSYDAICDMVRQTVRDNGPFMLFSCLLLFLYLLRTPYNFFIELETNRPLPILRQGNWILMHYFQLMVLVEPCHRLQQQNKRTARLLADLACQLGRHRLDIAPLRPFLLLVKISNFELGPSDVFAIGRPLVVTVIGGVTTYLIILCQFQNVSEII